MYKFHDFFFKVDHMRHKYRSFTKPVKNSFKSGEDVQVVDFSLEDRPKDKNELSINEKFQNLTNKINFGALIAME